MKKVTLQSEKRCIVCGDTLGLHRHEVFFGTADRRKSIKWGLQVYLCPRHHNASKEGVHFNKDLDDRLKRYAQTKFEEVNGHDVFMEIFHKNYL